MRSRRVILAGTAAEQNLEGKLKLWLGRALDSISRAYLDNSWLQAIVDGLAVLLGLLAIDAWFGYPAALRIAYIAPVYFACLRRHRHAEWFVMGVVILVSARVDAIALKNPAETGWIALTLRTAVFFGLAQAIHRVQDQLRNAAYRATHDQLTGAFNRLALETSLADAVRSHYVTGEPVTIAMIDCDKFKVLNDTYGHEHGDVILQSLVKQLQRTVPSNAMVGRNGGDEFVVIFRNRTMEQAEAYLAKAAERFVDATFALGTRAEISYGLSLCGKDGHDVPSMLRSADQNMYCRKALKGMAVVEMDKVPA